MINLRGLLFPVYDLQSRLGMGDHEHSSSSRILICEVSGHEIGVLVDRVSKVCLLSRAHLEQAPEQLLQNSEMLEAIYKDNQQFIHLLNLEKTLNLEPKRKEVG
ncbi:chemotaxis protein CheW [Paenibacillus ihuae]|uniref:chemotaxis protein CheW n=1 Tax=Paenibacillus ihuae TaxID=1232431 RepID=UPI001FD7486F|nr:chemotaxis protein CheW [Paenibacillus ihuae]